VASIHLVLKILSQRSDVSTVTECGQSDMSAKTKVKILVTSSETKLMQLSHIDDLRCHADSTNIALAWDSKCRS
jgi:hypothetical protein